MFHFQTVLIKRFVFTQAFIANKKSMRIFRFLLFFNFVICTQNLPEMETQRNWFITFTRIISSVKNVR